MGSQGSGQTPMVRWCPRNRRVPGVRKGSGSWGTEWDGVPGGLGSGQAPEQQDGAQGAEGLGMLSWVPSRHSGHHEARVKQRWGSGPRGSVAPSAAAPGSGVVSGQRVSAAG